MAACAAYDVGRKQPKALSAVTTSGAKTASGPPFLLIAIGAPKRTGSTERPIRVQARRRSLRVTIEWLTMAAELGTTLGTTGTL
jgi:hypothetical protein